MSATGYTATIQSAFDELLRQYARLSAAAGSRVAACRDAWPDTPNQGNIHDAECQACGPLLRLTQALDLSPWDTYPKEAFERLAEIETEYARR